MDASARFRAQLAEKIRAFFYDQQQGFDIPPAQLYRLEGFFEAGLLLNFISEPELKQALIDGAGQFLNKEVAAFYQQDYRLILHMRMHDAPVYPSSKSP